MDDQNSLNIISLGWGVQSWTMAAMVALGELPPVDFMIHSDTGWEMSKTYEFAKVATPWLKEKGIKVVTVTDESAHGMIKDEWEGTFIPAFTLTEKKGGELSNGQLRRQCTGRWKIVPMRRYISKYLKDQGIKKTPGVVNQWLGITTDEFGRAKDSDVKYIKHQFPLLDKKLNRIDCLLWLEKNGLPIPGKSACTFCPYHNRRTWENIKRENGADWKQSIMVDEKIRKQRPPYPLFVHPKRVPLMDAVKIHEDEGAEQLNMFDDLDDDNCDSGYCFL